MGTPPPDAMGCDATGPLGARSLSGGAAPATVGGQTRQGRLRRPGPPRAWPGPCPSCRCCRMSLTRFPSPRTPHQIQKMSPQHASVKAKAGRQERIRLLGPPALPARAEGLRRASGPQAPKRGSVGWRRRREGGCQQRAWPGGSRLRCCCPDGSHFAPSTSSLLQRRDMDGPLTVSTGEVTRVPCPVH